MATAERELRVTVAGFTYIYADADERAAAHRLAEARQELACESGRPSMPRWAQLSPRDRERAAIDACAYLHAAQRAGLGSDGGSRMRIELARAERRLAAVTTDQFTAGFQLGQATGTRRLYADELREAVSALVEIAGLCGHVVDAWPRNLAVADVAAYALTGARQLRERYRVAAREVSNRG